SVPPWCWATNAGGWISPSPAVSRCATGCCSAAPRCWTVNWSSILGYALCRTNLRPTSFIQKAEKNTMKIAVLSRNPNLYSTRRLVEAGRERGHEVKVIDTLRAYMNIASHKPSIHYKGSELEPFDAVIPRIGASITFYG